MEIKEVIGIDVSKLTLDCHIHGCGQHKVFDNNPLGISRMVTWVFESTEEKKEQVLFVFEHTGLYSHQLAESLDEKGCSSYIASGLEIKRSLGISRGKDDKADAMRIALYGYRVREEIKPHKLPSASLGRLKRLMSMRKKLVLQRAGHKATLREQKSVLEEEGILFSVQREIITVLSLQISALEKQMDKIIDDDPELKELQWLLLSVHGIGRVTARFLIIYTVGFTAFKTWRKFASYVGIAPFPYRSGTSIKGRNKVSRLAHKEGKVLLHLCACITIQSDPEMMAYYERRLEMGKSKMSTLNIIRNKLLARAFAVARRQTPYVNTMKYAL